MQQKCAREKPDMSLLAELKRRNVIRMAGPSLLALCYTGYV